MLEDRARRARDESEIRNLIARLAHLMDDGDLDEYGALLTEDSAWEIRVPAGETVPAPSRRGRADILRGARERRAAGIQGPGSHMRHVISNTAILRLDARAAVARSYMVYYRNADLVPEPVMFAVYIDECRREDDGWKLASRVLISG